MRNALLQKNRALFQKVSVQFSPTSSQYSYVALKQQHIKKGDTVVVPAGGVWRVVRVAAVGNADAALFETTYDVQMIVDRVDRKLWDHMEAQINE